MKERFAFARIELLQEALKLNVLMHISKYDLSKHMIYQIDHQVIEHNRTIKTSSHSTQ